MTLWSHVFYNSAACFELCRVESGFPKLKFLRDRRGFAFAMLETSFHLEHSISASKIQSTTLIRASGTGMSTSLYRKRVWNLLFWRLNYIRDFSFRTRIVVQELKITCRLGTSKWVKIFTQIRVRCSYEYFYLPLIFFYIL